MNFTEWLAAMKPGELLAWITGLGGLVFSLMTLLGKRGETLFSRIELERKLIVDERDRVTNKLSACEECVRECEEREEKVKQENEFLRAGHRAWLEFGEDIAGGSYGPDWVKDRAKQLVQRYKT